MTLLNIIVIFLSSGQVEEIAAIYGMVVYKTCLLPFTRNKKGIKYFCILKTQRTESYISFLKKKKNRAYIYTLEQYLQMFKLSIYPLYKGK